MQQRALARAALPDDRHELTGLNREIDSGQHRNLVLALAIALDQPASGYQRVDLQNAGTHGRLELTVGRRQSFGLFQS